MTDARPIASSLQRQLAEDYHSGSFTLNAGEVSSLFPNYHLFPISLSSESWVNRFASYSQMRLASRQLDGQTAAELIRQNSNKPTQAQERYLKCLDARSTPKYKEHGHKEHGHQEQVQFVVTGQQLGLFGGTLLTLYKALTTCIYARLVEERTKTVTIPVFWMQSEDHREDEINSMVSYNELGNLDNFQVELSTLPRITGIDSGRVPANAKCYTESVTLAATRFVSSLERFVGVGANQSESLTQSAKKAELLSCLSAVYTAESPVSEAFGSTLSQLLGDEGLLFFDPREAIKRGLLNRGLVSGFYRNALLKRTDIEKSLVEQGERIEALGYGLQVPIRHHSPLFFVHDKNDQRFRMEERDGTFTAIGNPSFELNEQELLTIIDTQPERLSTSALLRPLFQELVLPSCLNVLGPAEIAYTAQIAPLFPQFELSSALIAPRFSATLIEPKAEQWSKSLGIDIAELASTPPSNLDNFSKTFLSHLNEESTSVYSKKSQLLEAVSSLLAEIGVEMLNVEPTLKSKLTKTEERIKGSVEQLYNSFSDALSRHETTQHGRFSKLLEHIFPNHNHQERVISWVYYYLKYGDMFVDRIKSAILESAIEAQTLRGTSAHASQIPDQLATSRSGPSQLLYLSHTVCRNVL